jgi:hypothetical protein
LSAIRELVTAVLPAQERDDLALLQVTPPLRCAQARGAIEDQDELLLGKMVVVGIRRFARRDLPQAKSQPLAPGLAAEAGTLTAEPGVLAGLIEDGIVDVRHAEKRMRWRRGWPSGAALAICTARLRLL